ncbi:uncharacterized protein AMSG_05749 [Thecamonas trahens ATCC 50062]|uniref:Uncharacterized protein n=1 Tax=Thecamonas trahens ATCC 50062 TaxID=461836 RepID=A0A0L0DCC9_THETB|nr:hypothetical protein AMSG_05749 [Thecamonas trahens ATCC 50062]KNC49992.1 hypothetical protein AMSG_05749 [Thecamonas trahens ATCC 50062]|eukprot:XP_013757161.1 hypothetical protein AMSG_05749 [Thecamonas trahens ATCC 50062]
MSGRRSKSRSRSNTATTTGKARRSRSKTKASTSGSRKMTKASFALFDHSSDSDEVANDDDFASSDDDGRAPGGDADDDDDRKGNSSSSYDDDDDDDGSLGSIDDDDSDSESSSAASSSTSSGPTESLAAAAATAAAARRGGSWEATMAARAQRKARRARIFGRGADDVYTQRRIGRDDFRMRGDGSASGSMSDDESGSNDEMARAVDLESEIRGMSRRQQSRARNQAAVGSKPKYKPEVEAKLATANAAFGDGRYADAGTALQRAIQLDPKCVTAYTLLALVREHLGKHDHAARFYMLAADIQSNDASMWLLAASKMQDVAQGMEPGPVRTAFLEQAVNAFATADELARSHEHRMHRGAMLHEIGNSPRPPTADIASHLTVLSLLVPSLEHVGDSRRLVSVLEKFAGVLASAAARGVAPAMASSYLTKLVLLYVRQSRFADARAILRDHLDTPSHIGGLESRPLELRVVAGIVALFEGERASAEQEFTALLERDAADYADLYQLVADAFFDLKMFAEAAKVYSKLVDVVMDESEDPTSQHIFTRHAESLARVATTVNDAISVYHGLHQRQPDNVNVAVSLVELLRNAAANAAAAESGESSDDDDDAADVLLARATAVIDKVLRTRRAAQFRANRLGTGMSTGTGAAADDDPSTLRKSMLQHVRLLLHKAELDLTAGRHHEYNGMLRPILATALKHDPLFGFPSEATGHGGGSTVRGGDDSVFATLETFANSELLVRQGPPRVVAPISDICPPVQIMEHVTNVAKLLFNEYLASQEGAVLKEAFAMVLVLLGAESRLRTKALSTARDGSLASGEASGDGEAIFDKLIDRLRVLLITLGGMLDEHAAVAAQARTLVSSRPTVTGQIWDQYLVAALRSGEFFTLCSDLRILAQVVPDHVPLHLAHAHTLMAAGDVAKAASAYLSTRAVWEHGADSDPKAQTVLDLCTAASMVQLAVLPETSDPATAMVMATAYLRSYYERERMAPDPMGARFVEAAYNIGRAFHHVQLYSLALPAYEAALEPLTILLDWLDSVDTEAVCGDVAAIHANAFRARLWTLRRKTGLNICAVHESLHNPALARAVFARHCLIRPGSSVL